MTFACVLVYACSIYRLICTVLAVFVERYAPSGDYGCNKCTLRRIGSFTGSTPGAVRSMRV